MGFLKSASDVGIGFGKIGGFDAEVSLKQDQDGFKADECSLRFRVHCRKLFGLLNGFFETPQILNHPLLNFKRGVALANANYGFQVP